ncbi:MAG: fructokinase [Solirubrobacteraceae bacterium]|nr:fructokinase [Solirubrobacteraceae bacterium]
MDLVCHRPVASLAEADAFVAHLGGVSANVAVTASRAGAAVSLAGGAGDDAWGAWLHDRLAAEHVDLRWFGLAEGPSTALAFVTIDAAGEPSYDLYGDGIAAAIMALNDRLLEAVEACDALFFTSNTLAGEAEAALTMAARDRALELERPIVFDPNVRLHRWDDSPGRAAAAAGQCVPGAFLVKCNAAEARMLTGESDPEAAAASLLAAGAEHVIVTSGARGAILRGSGLRQSVEGRAADVVSTTGAGDVFLGTLLARLGTTDFYPPVLAAGLPDAAEAAALACERWGALE